MDAALALRPVLPAARARRAARDGRRLPRGHAAAPRADLHLQPRRAPSSSCARRTRPGRCSRSASPCLGGAAFGARVGPRRAAGSPRCRRSRSSRVAAWPLTTGHGAGAAARVRRARVLGAGRPTRSTGCPRTSARWSCPGQLFAYYDWGGTIDPILPALAERPVAERTIVPFADLRAVDLHVGGRRARQPGARAARPAAAAARPARASGAVVTQADGDRVAQRRARRRSRRADALGAASRSLARPARRFGAAARASRAARRPRPARRARCRGVRDRADARPGGIVRRRARASRADRRRRRRGGRRRRWPAFGALDPARPLAYAADLDAEAIRRAREATVVVTDTNRRQAFVAVAAARQPRLRAHARRRRSPRTARCSTRSTRGPDAQTVARLRRRRGGRRAVLAADHAVPRAPAVRGARRRPAHGVARRPRARPRPPLRSTVELDRPRAIGARRRRCPYDDERGRVAAHRGQRPRRSTCGRAGTACAVAGRRRRACACAIVDVTQPRRRLRRRGRDPRAAHPRRAGARVAAPAGARRARARGRLRAAALTLPLQPRRPSTRRCASAARRSAPFQSYRLRDRVDPERAAEPHDRAAGRARAGRSTRGCARRRRRRRRARPPGRDERRRVVATSTGPLRGARGVPRVEGVRRRPRDRVARRPGRAVPR